VKYINASVEYVIEGVKYINAGVKYVNVGEVTCGTNESEREVNVVGSSSKREAKSLEWGTDTKW